MARRAERPEHADARRDGLHDIGEAAALSGVSARMIRHYEAIGLIPPPGRSLANYRLYAESDLHRLRFIRRARSLGFPIRQIAALLDLWRDPQRASAEVKRLARAQADALAHKIGELQAMQRTLDRLARECHGDQRPECPILDDLADPGAERGGTN
jgi:MerR family transcriptional regulator, copper efflux regulator